MPELALESVATGEGVAEGVRDSDGGSWGWKSASRDDAECRVTR